MKKFVPVSVALFLILVMSVSSCKKDSANLIEPPPGGGGGGGGSVSDSLRSIVLDSLESKINQLPHIDREADNQAIYQYVRSLPAFSASGVRPSGVWARFQDGRVWAYVNNLEGTDTSWSRPASSLQVTASSRSSFSPSEELPQSSRARVMNGLGSAFDYEGEGGGVIGFTEAASNIRSWLAVAGYTTVSSSPTIEELKQVSGDGVFYYSAHGDTVPMDEHNTIYSLGLWTGTERTPAGDALYQSDLDAGRLWYFSAPHTAGMFGNRSETHYAITHEFVRTYMSFGPNSVVFINACKSAHPDFRDACIAKGAGMYIGWSNYAEAHKAVRTARFFFDRTLGANMEIPVLSPPQKGYQLYDVLAFMNTTGRDFTMHPTFGRANLEVYPYDASVTMLRPLVYSASPAGNELRILGWFGSNPGSGAATVTVGGTVVPIRNWVGESTISCEPVQHGGDVVVSIRGLRSKPVPLTKFSGTFSYVLHGRGSLTKRFDFNVEFLADVRTNRIQVDQSPSWELPRTIFGLQTSGGTFEASGEYRDQQGNLVESWSGSGSVTANVGGIIDKTGFAQSYISINATAPYVRNGNAATFSVEYGVGTLLTQMSDAFIIPGATYTGGNSSESATGTFSNITSTFAPTSNTAR